MVFKDKENSRFATFVIFVCQITCFFQLGIGLTVLNNSADALKQFVINSFQIRFNTSSVDHAQVQLMTQMSLTSYDVGSTFGALGVKFTTSYLSRRGSLALIHAFWLASAVLMSPIASMTRSVEAIIVGRVMGGIARGMSLSVVPLYVSEITNRNSLALYQAICTVFVEIGLILGSGIGDENLLGTCKFLPILFALPAVLSILFFIILPLIPEPPSWIILNKESHLLKNSSQELKKIEFHELESYKTLKKLRSGTEEDIEKEHQLVIDEIKADSAIEQATLWNFLKVSHYRKQLLAGIIIVAGPQLTGITLIFYYSDAIFQGAGLPVDLSSYLTIGLFGLVMIFTLCSFPLITRWGAKKVFVYSGFVVLVGLTLMTTSSIRPPIIGNHARVSVAGAILVIIGGIGPKQTFSILPSELTTYVTRPMVLWLSTLVYYICAVAITFITPYAMDIMGGYAYIPYIVSFVLVMAYVQYIVPDTHGKSAAEIQNELKVKDVINEKTPLIKDC